MARQLYSLDDGEQVVVHIKDEVRMTIIPGAGATVTWSRVDGGNASEHVAPTTDVLAADGPTAVSVDWPYYLVSTAGGSARVAAA